LERNYSSCTGGAVNIYVVAVEALRLKERQCETLFITRIDGFLSFTPPPNANVLFGMCFLNLPLFMTKRWVLVLRFHYFMDDSVVRLISQRECDEHLNYLLKRD
jgi:hypothetical protein